MVGWVAKQDTEPFQGATKNIKSDVISSNKEPRVLGKELELLYSPNSDLSDKMDQKRQVSHFKKKIVAEKKRKKKYSLRDLALGHSWEKLDSTVAMTGRMPHDTTRRRMSSLPRVQMNTRH